ncbi:YDG/SRA domain-containing protein [Streptomyces sp. NPDC057909]|uniref:YDG/SRA domain-containing protein n=1 Tax=Streptomyces sp. NPDC057909 TaxID=3346277 RepID=UPI0036EB5BCF
MPPKSSKSIYFGPPPGVQEGAWFKGHDGLYAADVHRFRGQGISGTAHEGVDSIVASGGYAGDEDLGDTVIYTAQGGAPDEDGHITADQSLTKVNEGMVLNYREGLPIRFVRGLGIKRGKATKGYRYRGLYLVEDYWSIRTERGHLMWQFRLAKDLTPLYPDPVDEGAATPDEQMTAVEKAAARYVNTQRRVRNTAAARAIKALYNNTCQMCSNPVVVDVNGARYSEGAHIHALGKPHGGHDIQSNILCLCPNCHVLFDNGARLITDDLKVIDALTGQVIRDLYVKHDDHRIDRACLQQHRSRWADRSQHLEFSDEGS